MFDVIVGRTWLQVDTPLEGKDQFWEDGCPPLTAQALDPDIEDGFLNFPLKKVGSQPKTKRGEGRLTIGGKEGIDFVLQRLHGIIDVLLGLGDGIVFPLVLCHPFLGILEVLFIIELGIRGQNLIDTVSRTAPILTRSHVGNDL